MTDNAQQGTWQLRMVRGSRPGQTYAVDRAFAIIGRDASNDVVIDEPGVSRRHAQLIYRDGWFHVQDLGSANQVAVNGVPVRGSMRIGPGDQIALSNDVTLALEWIPASEQTVVVGDATPTPPQGTRAPVYEMPTQQWQPASTQPPPPPTAPPQARQSADRPPERREQRGVSALTLAFVGCGAVLFALAVIGIVGALVYTGVLPNPLDLVAPSSPTATSTSIVTVAPTAEATATMTQAPTTTSAPPAEATATMTVPAAATTAPTETATTEPTSTQVPTETAVPPTATATPPPPTPTSPPPPTATPPPPTATPPPPTATPPPTPLSIDHVIESAACISKGQYRIEFMIYVDGGTGQYFVYRDIESQAIYGPGPAKTIPYELTWGAGSSAVGTLVVRSGGESAESKFYVPNPDCSGF